jgi:hypothetical protein
MSGLCSACVKRQNEILELEERQATLRRLISECAAVRAAVEHQRDATVSDSMGGQV